MKFNFGLIVLSSILLQACKQPDYKSNLKAHYLQVASNAMHWKDYNTAATAWQNLYALDNSNAPMLDSAFSAYNQQPNYKAVAALGKDILRAHLKDEPFAAALVTAYRETGEYQAAIDASRLHISLTKDTMPDYYYMGLCFLDLKDFPNAVGYMGRVLADTSSIRRVVNVKGQTVPYYAAALNIIGIAEIKQGNVQNGAKALSEALRVVPNFSAANNNFNMLRQISQRP